MVEVRKWVRKGGAYEKRYRYRTYTSKHKCTELDGLTKYVTVLTFRMPFISRSLSRPGVAILKEEKHGVKGGGGGVKGERKNGRKEGRKEGGRTREVITA